MKPLIPLLLVVAGVATVAAVRRDASPELPLPSPVVDVVLAAGTEQTAYFAGGCFWGIEAVFEHI